MQSTSRHTFWKCLKKIGTHIIVRFNESTGNTIKFYIHGVNDKPVYIDWGDGDTGMYDTAWHDPNYTHTYNVTSQRNQFEIILGGARCFGFRFLDGGDGNTFDNALIGVVDYSGNIAETNSGAFKNCQGLKSFIAPNAQRCGQADFENCANLREIRLPRTMYFFDNVFRNCVALETITVGGGILWNNVFDGCTNLGYIRFTGKLDEINGNCFSGCPNLNDIFVKQNTVNQVITQRGIAGCVTSMYSRFPWGANPSTRFHCSDGIIRGDNSRVIPDSLPVVEGVPV